MKIKTWLTWSVIIIFLLASQACNLPFLGDIGGSATTPGATQSVPTGKATLAPTSARATPTAPKPTITPTKALNAVPLPLRQGLASLDSFKLQIDVVVTGPTSLDVSTTSSLFVFDNKTNNSHTRLVSTSSSADDPEVETNIMDTYTVGKQSCQLSSSDPAKTPTGEITENDPLQDDVTGALSSLFDFTVYTENPVFVGQETVNGIPTNHFSFKVTKLGKESGVVVNKNSGDYWIARDGQYLVKYIVVMELTRDKQGTEIFRTEMSIDLTSVNQPVQITMPPNCKPK